MARTWDTLDRGEYVRLQETLLRDFVTRFLYPFSPFYRQHLDAHGIKPYQIRRVRDLQQIPPVSAQDFARSEEDPWRPFRALLRPDEDRLKRWAHRVLLGRVARERLYRGDDAAERVVAEEFKPVHLLSSPDSGPVVGYTLRDLSAMSQAGARALAVAGGTRTSVLVSTLPYGPQLPFWNIYYGALGAGMTAFHLGAGEAIRPSEVARWMARVGATMFVAQPAYAEGLLRGAPPAAFGRLRTLALWGIGGMAGARERFTTMLRTGGAPEAGVTTLLGIPEARAAWAECPTPPGQPEASYGYHTYPDLELLEVVDDAGHVVADGEPGELLYTSLDWRGSVMLRYRTGLFLRRGITRAACPGCGRTVPRIDPDISRVEWRTTVRTRKGEVPVDLADVMPALWRASSVPVWELEVIRDPRGGGSDSIVAYLGGADQDQAREVQRALAPYGVRCKVLPFPQLSRRLALGLERPEARVRFSAKGSAKS
ncbi:MAG: phenylacetate--CoA ligase family protein [Actinomycetota bacterium]